MQVVKTFVLTIALTFGAVGTIAALMNKFRYNYRQTDFERTNGSCLSTLE